MTKWLTLILVALIGYNVLSSHVDAQGSGTINQLSPFQVSGGVVRLASTTAGFRIPSLQSITCLGTDSSGNLQLGTCTGGGSGGTDTLFNWNQSTNIISTDGSSTTATTSLSTNGFTANNATITNATSTTGWFSSVVRALNAVFTNATTTNLRTTQLGVGSDYITDLTGTGLSIVGNALTATNDHVAVTVSGARDYITLSGQDIVRGVVDISDDTNLSGDTEVVLTGDALSLGESLTFTSATATNLASTLSTTSVFYGAGLTDCDTAGTSKLLWDVTTGKFSCGTDQNTGGGGSSNWVLGGAGYIQPSTTVGIRVSASSTIGDGTATGGLTISGSGTTTGTSTARTLVVGNNGLTLQSAIVEPAGWINASTSGRSGVLFQNYGTGTAPEFRFTIGDPYSASALEYLALGLTNNGATTPGTLAQLTKDKLAYILNNARRDLLITSGNTGTENLYLAAGFTTLPPLFKIDGVTQRVGIGMSTSSVPTSTLSVNGNIFTANITATGTASSTYASTSNITIYQALYDTNSQPGTNNQVLTSTGTSTLWRSISVAGDGVSNWSYDGTRLTPTSSNAGILVNGSSTISLFNFTSATGTNATTTNLFATLGRFTTASSSYASSTSLSTSALRILGLSDGCVNITSGLLGTTGSACGSGAVGSGLATATADYIVYKSGSNVVALKTSTGATIATNASADVVFQAIFTDATTTSPTNERTFIFVKGGYYPMNATSTLWGSGGDDGPHWVIQGAGQNSTVFAVASTTVGFNMTGRVKVTLRDMQFAIKGKGSALVATGVTTGERSVWNSVFDSITFISTTTDSTGHAIRFGNDFRNTYNNLEFMYVGNCIRSYTQGASFNNGDSTYTNMMCDLQANANSNRIAYEFDGAGGGLVNQNNFIQVNSYNDSDDNTAWRFNNAHWNTGISINSEGFATTTEMLGSTGNSLNYNYVTVSASGNYFSANSSSEGNTFECTVIDNPGGTRTLFRDSYSGFDRPNVLRGKEGSTCQIQGSGAVAYATTSASVVDRVYDAISGNTAYTLARTLGDRVSFDFGAGNTSYAQYSGSALRFFTGSTERMNISSTGLTSITDLSATRATNTSATSTTLFSTLGRFTQASSTGASTTALTVYQRLFDTNSSAGTAGQVLTSTGTSTLWTTLTSSSGGGSHWILNAGADALTPSSTKGIVINASSSIFGLSVTNGTTTNSTSTNLFATLLRATNASTSYASTTGLTVHGNSILGNATTSSLGILSLTSVNCDVKATTGGGLYCGTDAGGSGSPGGSDTNIQYNSGGAFAGSNAFRWNDSATNLLLGYEGQTTSITLLDATSTDTNGVSLNVFPGDGFGAGSGGEFSVEAGTGGDNGSGGNISLQSGVGGAVSGNGGNFFFSAGNAVSSGNGGGFNMEGGTGRGGGNGGSFTMTSGGINDGSGSAGSFEMSGGAGLTTGNGGSFTMAGGSSGDTSPSQPGYFAVTGGDSLWDAKGAYVSMRGGIGTSLLYGDVFLNQFGGNVGIGTSSPNASLSIRGYGTTSPFVVASTSNSNMLRLNANGNFFVGAGTNNNVNPNINLLVQGASDARMGVAVNDHGLFQGIGDGSTYTALFPYNYATGNAPDLSIAQFGGRVGINTTAPTALFHVASSSYSSGSLFKISTSTSQVLVDVYATTTGLLTNTSSLPIEQDSGTRIRLGTGDYYNRADQLDQIVLNGRIRNPEWFVADCPIPVGATAISADGQACDSFTFGETTAATLTAVAGNGYSYGQLGGVGANDGGMVGLDGASAGWLRLATSTPSMEVTARIGTIVSNSSTTAYVIGFSNAPVASPAATEPTVGCFFIASSTMANWHATCRTALGTGTKVDTGIASTSIVTGAGTFKVFRIDADSDNARFFIKDGTGIMTEVANITGTYPTTQALNAGISFHRGVGTQAIQFDFFGLNVQWRKFTPNL